MGTIKKKEKKKGFGYFLRRINKKHRLSVREQHSDTELSYIYISTLRIILAVIGVLLVMFALVIFTVVYTPVLDNLPGNPGKNSRDILTENILRLDSLQNELAVMMQYGENVALVMEGKTPVVRTMRQQDAVGEDKDIVPPNAADSLIRAQVGGEDGRYSLTEAAPFNPRGGVRPVDFIMPVRGAMAERFNPVAGMFGIGLELAESQPLIASAAGTVVMSLWTPEDDYVIQLQHKDNYITLYKRATQLLKSVGEQVEAGEVIGYVNRDAMMQTADGGRVFIFELWNNGRPADPIRYIFF